MKKIFVILAILFLAAPVGADQLYESTYKFDADGPMTSHSSDNFNTINQSLDNRLDTLEDYDSNSFKTISVSGEDDVVADDSDDTLTLVAGSNVTLTNTASSDTIQIDVSTTPLDTLNSGVEVVSGTTDLDFDANFSVTDEGSNESGIALVDDPTIAGYLSVTEQITLTEMAAPGNPSANDLHIYSADSAGTTKLYCKDSAGTVTDLTAGINTEGAQDLVGAMTTGNTETLITVTYQDADGTIDYVVDDDLSGYDWTAAGTSEEIEDDAGAMWTGNTETNITVTYQDADGTIDAVVSDAFLVNDADDTTTGSITLDDGVGDSPSLVLQDATNETGTITKTDGGELEIRNTTANADNYIDFHPSNDSTNYIRMSVSSSQPKIEGTGSNNLIIDSGSGTVDFNGNAVTGIAGVTFSGNLYVDDGTGDSPQLGARDGDDKSIYLIKLDTGPGGLVNNEGAIEFRPSNDTDDFFSFTTASNVPTIGTTGTCNLDITSSSGEIGFDDDNLTTTGTIDSGVLTVTGLIYSDTGFDGVGAVDLDYGSADITDHTFTTDDCTVIIDGGVTVSAGGTITLGSTSLGETTAANDSGAYIVGVYDEFDHSNSANVQDVLDDLDAAMTAGTADPDSVHLDEADEYTEVSAKNAAVLADLFLGEDSADSGNKKWFSLYSIAEALNVYVLQNGADPDISTIGEISYDTDDHIIRGFDGVNQPVLASRLKQISFTVGRPKYLDDASTHPVWRNELEHTLNIVGIYSMSDDDDVNFTLDIVDSTDFTSTTEIKAITVDTNGTGVYYSADTSGFTDTTVTDAQVITFDNDATDDPDWIQVTIVGWLDGDVN